MLPSTEVGGLTLNLPVFDTRSVLIKLGVIIAFALTAGFFLPALAAAFSHVFWDVDCTIIKIPEGLTCKQLHPQGFYLHIVSYFWPLMYMCLGITVFIAHPPDRDVRHAWRASYVTIITTAVAIYAIDVAPLWHRTFLAAGTTQRRVFAYSNPDISLVSFIVQQINFMIFAALIAFLWVQWLTFASTRYKELLEEEIGAVSTVSLNTIARLSITMFQWQTVCTIISAAFILYTANFWNQIIVNNDLRFGYEAVISYLIWVFTLVSVTIPLALTWFFWRMNKIKLIMSLSDPKNDGHSSLEIIRELEPVGIWNAAISGFGVLASFAVPIVQAVVQTFVHR
jgi:hypothetical protein